ncbi:hypothetical protein D3C78_1713590 [compost metagenome]
MSVALVLTHQFTNGQYAIDALVLRGNDPPVQQSLKPGGVFVTFGLSVEGHVQRTIKHTLFLKGVLPCPIRKLFLACHAPSA